MVRPDEKKPAGVTFDAGGWGVVELFRRSKEGLLELQVRPACATRTLGSLLSLIFDLQPFLEKVSRTRQI